MEDLLGWIRRVVNFSFDILRRVSIWLLLLLLFNCRRVLLQVFEEISTLRIVRSDRGISQITLMTPEVKFLPTSTTPTARSHPKLTLFLTKPIADLVRLTEVPTDLSTRCRLPLITLVLELMPKFTTPPARLSKLLGAIGRSKLKLVVLDSSCICVWVVLICWMNRTEPKKAFINALLWDWGIFFLPSDVFVPNSRHFLWNFTKMSRIHQNRASFRESPDNHVKLLKCHWYYLQIRHFIALFMTLGLLIFCSYCQIFVVSYLICKPNRHLLWPLFTIRWRGDSLR